MLPPLVAAERDPGIATEELLFMDIETVFTPSRRTQSIQESPTTIDVLTSDEIAASKALNIWDLLRYRVGMDVYDTRSIWNNYTIATTRGFADENIGSMQVLIDGRSIYLLAGGVAVYWQNIPVQLQDIERIEIVRGPNAALFGSNAGFGVINIITKRPQETAVTIDTLYGNQANGRIAETVETAGKTYGLRVSHTYRSSNGFVDAAGNKIGTDVSNTNKINLRGFWNPTPKGTLEIFGGNIGNDTPANDWLHPGFEKEFRENFQTVKYTQDFGWDSSLEMTGSRRDSFPTIDYRNYQYDAEALLNHGWGKSSLNTAIGISYRDNVVNCPDYFGSSDPRRRNAIYRGFANQSWKILSKLTLTGAFSLEHSDIAGTQPAYQASAISPVNKNHTLRISYAMSPTLPDIFYQQGNSSALNLVGNKHLGVTRVTSSEISHLGNFMEKKLDTEISFYYMTVVGMHGQLATNPSGVTTGRINDAIARGIEAKGRYRFQKNRYVYANYTFESITDDKANPSITDDTPNHKTNVGFYSHIWKGLSASADAGYKTGYRTTSRFGGTRFLPAYTRLDARLMYTFKNMEFFLAGQNLTRARHPEEFPGGVGNYYIPRLYYGGMTVKFGPVQD